MIKNIIQTKIDLLKEKKEEIQNEIDSLRESIKTKSVSIKIDTKETPRGFKNVSNFNVSTNEDVIIVRGRNSKSLKRFIRESDFENFLINNFTILSNDLRSSSVATSRYFSAAPDREDKKFAFLYSLFPYHEFLNFLMCS